MTKNQVTEYSHYTKPSEDLQKDVPYLWCCQCHGFIPVSRVSDPSYHVFYVDCFGELKVARDRYFCPDCGHPLGLNVRAVTVIACMSTAFEPIINSPR